MEELFRNPITWIAVIGSYLSLTALFYAPILANKGAVPMWVMFIPIAPLIVLTPLLLVSIAGNR